MAALIRYFRSRPLDILLLFAFIAPIVHWFGPPDLLSFAFSAIALIPLAGLIGRATESLAVYTGPKIGGLLNATLGNAAELIITIVAIKAGLLELVKASITGSILGNLLLVLGLAIFLGGRKHGLQSFDRKHAMNNAILMTISILALLIPSVFSHSIGPDGSMRVEVMSLGVATMMIILYIAGLVYSLTSSAQTPQGHIAAETHKPEYSKLRSFIVLGIATLGVVLMSEILVSGVEQVTSTLGLSEFFIGIILIPIIGNVAEHLVAVTTALRNKMDLSVEIAVSSSIQIALFVAPILVFLSLAMGNPMTLIFNQLELISIACAILITALVSIDGESNWLEGLSLLFVYIMLGLAFFLMPV